MLTNKPTLVQKKLFKFNINTSVELPEQRSIPLSKAVLLKTNSNNSQVRKKPVLQKMETKVENLPTIKSNLTSRELQGLR